MGSSQKWRRAEGGGRKSSGPKMAAPMRELPGLAPPLPGESIGENGGNPLGGKRRGGHRGVMGGNGRDHWGRGTEWGETLGYGAEWGNH